MKPSLRSEGIICDETISKVLVQCDIDETFYRFPGGTVEFGETTLEAITRELIEEFDLAITIGSLVVINENLIIIDGKEIHNCTLLYKCKLQTGSNFVDPRWHNEIEGIKLTWKTIEELQLKPLYADGILNVLKNMSTDEKHHIIIKKSY
ncbi:NUDIX domain-containing protein [Paenibacillus anaericanus]|uniref:NUDIX domain-containing protein n=1 Tax=Paenibacillus anaericanus TaxID=170367 RepID=A0A3S1BSU7_9BACL|nr:NUDIX domain-containing protein [Paenibacillus anaericanus]